MRVKNLMFLIHRGQKSLKKQYEIIIFASKFHLGASWCPPGRVGAPWAYFGLQYCFKMGVLGLSWALIPSQDGPSSPSQGSQARPKGVLGGLLGLFWGVLGRLGLMLGFNIVSRWAPWAYFWLQDCLKMGVFGLSWASISFQDGPRSLS